MKNKVSKIITLFILATTLIGCGNPNVVPNSDPYQSYDNQRVTGTMVRTCIEMCPELAIVVATENCSVDTEDDYFAAVFNCSLWDNDELLSNNNSKLISINTFENVVSEDFIYDYNLYAPARSILQNVAVPKEYTDDASELAIIKTHDQFVSKLIYNDTGVIGIMFYFNEQHYTKGVADYGGYLVEFESWNTGNSHYGRLLYDIISHVVYLEQHHSNDKVTLVELYNEDGTLRKYYPEKEEQ